MFGLLNIQRRVVVDSNTDRGISLGGIVMAQDTEIDKLNDKLRKWDEELPEEFKESRVYTEVYTDIHLYDKPKSVTEQLQEDYYVDDWEE